MGVGGALIDDLKAARALIAKPENWTTESYARRANGVPTPTLANDAVSFCTYGACDRASNRNAARREAMMGKLRAALQTIAPDSDGVVIYNDSATHAEVLVLFDKAIEIAGEAA